MGEAEFSTLSGMKFQLNSNGTLYRFPSNRAVILRGNLEGKEYGVKIFTAQNDSTISRYKLLSELNLSFIPKYRFLEDELSIKSFYSDAPIKSLLLYDWIEGHTLDEEIAQLCSIGNRKSLIDLRFKVLELFIKLVSTDIIHGDIKFENILVTKDKELLIIDWDAFYHPDLTDSPTDEIGTQHFAHPFRGRDDYGKRLDDYPMALIIMTLTFLTAEPSLYKRGEVLVKPSEVRNNIVYKFTKMISRIKYMPSLNRVWEYVTQGDLELTEIKWLLENILGVTPYDKNRYNIVDSKGRLKLISDKATKLYGFYDSGKDVVAVEVMYGDATPFRSCRAGVRINDKWFFIDDRGVKISPYYDKISLIRGDIFRTIKDGAIITV